MGDLLTRLPSLSLGDCGRRSCQLQEVRATETSKFPIVPMGNSRFDRCLQGGGVAVFGGTVTISSCTISGNTAGIVRAHPQKFPMPPWETHLLLVVCRAVVSMSMVAQCQS
jgi:hypothetical protein